MAGAAAGLERALLASLALHGAVLAGVSLPGNAPIPPSAALEPITARIVEPAPLAEIPVVESRPEPIRKSQPVVEKKIEVVETPAPVAVVRIPEPATTVSPAPTPVAPSIPASPAAAAEPVADASAVRQYRKVFLNTAGQFKTYPDLARENSWSGDVAVAVAFGADGGAEVALRRGSGHEVLDQQALDMFRRAARAAPPPAELRGRAFRLDVRAVYGLED